MQEITIALEAMAFLPQGDQQIGGQGSYGLAKGEGQYLINPFLVR
jgi:hypothetical protein